STAVVVISRAGQEGSDKKYDGYADGTPHYLALSQREIGTIQKAKELCDSLIVVIASSAPMEVLALTQGELEADAILQVGHVGEKGFAALGPILCGDVNPSGRTMDIWPADFTKDPTYQNFGEFSYTNATFTTHSYGNPSTAREDGSCGRYFVEYEEGVYVGYRFYETADLMDEDFVYGTLDEGGAVTELGSVVYPFGYGLSYTTFEEKMVNFSAEGDEIQVEVEVTNTGLLPGKKVVELYYSAPYTDLDVELFVEKPARVLGDFAKTQMLQPGESQVLTLTLAKDEMASYCYTHENADGTKGAYFLEAGDYAISLCENSHVVTQEETFTCPETIWYEGENLRASEKEAQSEMAEDGTALETPLGEGFVAASNLFEESNAYMLSETTMLSRANWKETFPTMPENRQKEVGEAFVSSFGIEESFDVENDSLLGNQGELYKEASEAPVAQADLMVSDMRGIPYNDAKWDAFLNQVDLTNAKQRAAVVKMMTVSNYATYGVEQVGLPATKEADGANGMKSVKTDAGMELTATYSYAPLMASTWNTELMYELGEMLGKEALATGISGWYSPAINMHRSPFGGRVYEYYSEDPVLTGKMASQVVSGAGDAGMFCYIKHFAINEM
ncbi:MAG: glycoside hydrolase family 3 C-terminal domain-containing protein, partial [Blautia sp.]|nr:glycoside hydrolase family 3 C-terminal domain-containing protein [Blautia sp.]